MNRLFHGDLFTNWVEAVRQIVVSIVLRIGRSVLMILIFALAARNTSIENFGIIAVYFSVFSIFSVLIAFGYPTKLTRVAANELTGNLEIELAEAIRFQLRTFSTIICVIALVVVAIGPLRIQMDAVTVALCSVAAVFIAALQTFSGALRGVGKVVAGQIFEQLVFPSVLIALLAFTVVLIANGEVGPRQFFLAVTIAAILAALGSFRRLSLHLKSRTEMSSVKWLTWRKISLAALPIYFVLNDGLMVLMQNADVLMIALMEREVSAGIYRVASQIALVSTLVLAAVNAVYFPIFCKQAAKNDFDALRKSYARTLVLSSTACLLAFFAIHQVGRPLIALVFGSDYVESWTPAIILLLGYTLNQLIGPVGMLLNAMRKEKLVFMGLVAALIFNILLNFVLIPRYGVSGAALATVSSHIFSKILMVWLGRSAIYRVFRTHISRE